MKLHYMPQRSEEWFAVRRGHITSTSFATMAAGKTATRETICYRAAAEILTGQTLGSDYTNPAIEHGIETEEIARAAYELEYLTHVDLIGFVEVDDYIGVSPDGFVWDNGIVEIKCPEPHTHLRYLTSKGLAWKAYRWQCQGMMWATGRDWLRFVSYCADFPTDKQLRIELIKPDPESFEKLEAGAAYCRERIKQIVEAANVTTQ